MTRLKNIFLLSAMLISVVGTNASQAQDLHVYSAEMKFPGGEYTVNHVFYSGFVVEVATQNGKTKHVGFGSCKLKGNQISIDWSSGGKERATIKTTSSGMKYRITSHTDKQQVGMVLDYRRTRLNHKDATAFRDFVHKVKLAKLHAQAKKADRDLEEAIKLKDLINTYSKIADIWTR